MLGFSPVPASVWLVLEPVDMRLGIDGLSARIQQSLGRSPCDGTAYAFRNRRGTRIKLLQWDGTGVWLSQRRLHRGSFVWPRAGEQLFTLSLAQWHWLITGVDWQRLEAKIQALTLELAHLKRIRFGVKNEALSPEQRDLFRETLEVDSASIAAETELQVPACAPHASAPGGSPCPSICHASSIVTSQQAAPAVSAVARW